MTKFELPKYILYKFKHELGWAVKLEPKYLTQAIERWSRKRVKDDCDFLVRLFTRYVQNVEVTTLKEKILECIKEWKDASELVMKKQELIKRVLRSHGIVSRKVR